MLFACCTYATDPSNQLSTLPGLEDGGGGGPTNGVGTNAPAPGTIAAAAQPDIWTALAMIIIPFVTPVIVLLGKKILPAMPPWFLPILAPGIGALLAWISTVAGGPHVNPMIALILGSAGVGFRELKDQVGWRMANGPAAVSMIAIFASVSLALGVLCGCAGGPVQVKPGSDAITVTAEWTAENGANAFNEFFLFERTHDAGKAVHEFAESLRSTPTKAGIAAQSLIDLRAASETYKKDKTAANGSKVQAALNLVLNLANSARTQMGLPPLSVPTSGASIFDQLTQPTNGPPANPVSP